MPSFEEMQRRYSGIDTIGQQLKQMSDEAIQETFDNNIVTKPCYIYDYYHDDQMSKKCFGYNPALSKTKIPVKLKFIIKTYKSMSKEDPEYHIMFEPDVWNSMSCKPDWFVNGYESLGVEFPVGLYLDIPDDRGIYRKWLITYIEIANQNVKCGVLRCNHLFQWIEDDGIYRHKRNMWGIDSTQSSYTSGVWSDYKSTTYDDQDKFYLPWNQISSELRHDTRLCISMLQKQPWTYKITKVNNTSPKGLIIFTVKQDRYEPLHDYIQLNPNADDYGDMYADYYSSTITPEKKEEDVNYKKCKIVIETPNFHVKLGNYKILTAKVYDASDNDITHVFINSDCIWDFKLDDISLNKKKLIHIDTNYSSIPGNEFKCKFRFDGDEQYIGNNITATCSIDELYTEVLLDVINL